MRANPLPLVGGSYADEDRPYSMQDTVNYLPCQAEVEGTRSGEMLKTPPGLRPYLELPDLDPPVKRTVRGTHNAEGRMFAVIGTTAYRISNAGVAIPLGTIPGNGRVAIEHNQISLGNEVTFMTGSAGYVYNTVTDVFARITDAGFPGSITSKFIDGFIIGIEPQGRYAFNSDPAQATSYNTLNRFTSEVRPDRLTAAAVSNNELLLFSESSGEFFYNSGAAQQPFRSKRISMDKGCVGPFAAIEADNTVFWLGPGGYFYQLDGYGARRISTRPIEQSLRGVNLSTAFAGVWEDAGHTVVYWTFPNGLTWGWDTAQQRWHRRESYGLTRWRANTLTQWNGAWYAGDFQKPRLWRLDWSYILEGDQEFESYRTMAVIHDNQSRMLHNRLELVMDTGQPLTEAIGFPAQPDPPTISGDAPNGLQANAYSFSYTLGSGTPPYVVTLREGTLPAGLSLSTAGAITGTPTAEADATFTVRVTDATGLWAEIEDTIEVPAAIPAPLLVTNNEGFNGAPDALVATVSLGVGSGGGARRVRVSPNGLYAAFSTYDSVASDRFGIKKWNIGTGEWDALSAPDDMPTKGPRNMAWSRGGRYLACAIGDSEPNNLLIYELVGDELQKLADPAESPSGSALCVAWDDDDARLAVGANLGGYVYDFVDGELLNIREFDPGFVAEALDFMPGSDSLYLACGQANFIYVVNAETAAVVDIESTAASEGVFWDAAGEHIFALAGITPDELNVWTFDGTLALAGAADTSPPTNCADSSITYDRAYLVAACLGDDTVYSYDLSTPLTPALVDTATTPNLEAVSWRES